MIQQNYKAPFPAAIKIQEENILPGTQTKILLSAGKLPSGSQLSITTHVFRASKPGPTVLLLGGIHGDEINGIEIITSLLESQYLQQLKSGCVLAIPLLNVFGFNNMSRDMPDGKDVNRSFPGNKSGSLASRVARSLTQNILPLADYAIDLHTGGAHRYNYPHTRYTPGDDTSQILAEVFAAPFAVKQALIAHSFRKVANDMHTHVLVYEAGESGRIDGLAVKTGIQGILNVLTYLEMLPPQQNLQSAQPTLHFNKTTWVRASNPGLFSALVTAGQKVKEGMLLGNIKDPYGVKSYAITSKVHGYIIGINHAAVVNQGDAIFHVGSYDEKHN
ncbi:MAG: succinylglutamate desuccinylase/aspartoacylase family protein [Saprospiraceae bacterium]